MTYSKACALGSGIKEEHDGGLTAFGKKCVERMNKVAKVIGGNAIRVLREVWK